MIHLVTLHTYHSYHTNNEHHTYHTNHHTRIRKTREANYASILTLWDKLFFSYIDATDKDREIMGVNNREIELKLIDNLYHPFNKKVDSD